MAKIVFLLLLSFFRWASSNCVTLTMVLAQISSIYTELCMTLPMAMSWNRMEHWKHRTPM